jgi:hypothetical protein
MKTTLQEIIDELKIELDTNIIAYHEISIMKWVIGIIESKLEKEKEQIIDAYENGVGDENERNLSGKFTNAEDYYNQTYNQNK